MVETMLELAGVGPGDVVYDLGCNDGRVCITAARDPGGGGQGQTSGARRAGCELRSQLTISISPSARRTRLVLVLLPADFTDPALDCPPKIITG